jgi:fructose-1-phosphate kinase PfkB-like protein
LAATLPAAPYLVTPNLAEAEALLDGRVDELVDEDGVDLDGRAIRAAVRLRARGPRYAVVTAGRFGAALAGPDATKWFDAAPITPVNPIGSGDSFLGGVAHALDRGAPMRVAVPFGMAVAAAACETERAGIFAPPRLTELLASSPTELARLWGDHT